MPERGGWLQRMATSIQAWQRALGRAAVGGQVLEVGPLVGSVVPAAPSRSILNAAAAPAGAQLTQADLQELGERYANAGVTRWGVWAHEDEAPTTAALQGAGLVVDSRPTAMAVDLANLTALPPRPGIEVQRTDDLALLGEPLGAAYGFPAPFLAHGLPSLLDHVEGWLARVDGARAAGAIIARADDDAGVFLVGTDPELRRRGAAAATLHAALLAARAQGCTTSTLQASAMGRPVYAQLGYRDLGSHLLWESRALDG